MKCGESHDGHGNKTFLSACQGDVIGQVSVFNKETTESIYGPGKQFGVYVCAACWAAMQLIGAPLIFAGIKPQDMLQPLDHQEEEATWPA